MGIAGRRSTLLPETFSGGIARLGAVFGQGSLQGFEGGGELREDPAALGGARGGGGGLGGQGAGVGKVGVGGGVRHGSWWEGGAGGAGHRGADS